MKSKIRELQKQAEQLVTMCLMVPNDMLPPSYRGKRKMRKLESVVSEFRRRTRNRKPAREVSVKFDAKQNVTFATPIRLRVLEAYRANASQDMEIDYLVNEDRLYRNQMAFCSALGIDLED